MVSRVITRVVEAEAGGMWLVLGTVVIVVGWLLMMISIWTLLYAHGEQSEYPGDANHH